MLIGPNGQVGYGAAYEVPMILFIPAWILSGLVATLFSYYFYRGITTKRAMLSAVFGPFYMPYLIIEYAFIYGKGLTPSQTAVQDVKKVQNMFKAHGVQQPDGPFSAWRPNSKKKENDQSMKGE